MLKEGFSNAGEFKGEEWFIGDREGDDLTLFAVGAVDIESSSSQELHTVLVISSWLCLNFFCFSFDGAIGDLNSTRASNVFNSPSFSSPDFFKVCPCGDNIGVNGFIVAIEDAIAFLMLVINEVFLVLPRFLVLEPKSPAFFRLGELSRIRALHVSDSPTAFSILDFFKVSRGDIKFLSTLEQSADLPRFFEPSCLVSTGGNTEAPALLDFRCALCNLCLKLFHVLGVYCALRGWLANILLYGFAVFWIVILELELDFLLCIYNNNAKSNR